MDKLIHWLKAHQLPCFIKNNYGIDCPGCGIQSAVIHLLEGNVIKSFNAYPALIPLLISLLFLLFYRLIKRDWIEKVLIVSLISTAIIIIGNFILKTVLN